MKDVYKLVSECETDLKDIFDEIDATAQKNSEKVLKAFSEYKLSERHFAGTTGYGYDDDGREVCEKIFARAFGCEEAAVRHNIISGTHAITIGLFGILRTGDTMLSVTGMPYDTIEPVIGITPCDGSLAEYGIHFKKVDLTADGKFDFSAIKAAIDSDSSIKMIYAQRSKGYQARRTIPACEFEELYNFVKQYTNAYVVVDNCYGEFCDVIEPKADLIIGSLIKNAGGGIAECGGYLAGTKEAVEKVSNRLTVPGVGREEGATLGHTKNILKGLFFAPHVVAQALKTAHLAAAVFEAMGFNCLPTARERRHCLVQTIDLNTKETMLAFCKGIQSGSPVDSFVTPEGCQMPGYTCDIVMAAGTFTQGSSIELSADGPLVPPYRVYMQGGLTYESGKYGVIRAAEEILKLSK